jgi:hypothetical protein
MNPSDTRPWPGASKRLLAEPISGRRRRASRVARCSLSACCHPPPRRSGLSLSSVYAQSMAAFPQSRQGRPSHRVFRGRLGVHTCYGLPTCRRPNAAFCLPGSDHFVTSVVAGIATRPRRPLPGQDLHLLEQQTFHGAPGPLDRALIAGRSGLGPDGLAGDSHGELRASDDIDSNARSGVQS